MWQRTVPRVAFLGILVVLAGFLAYSYVTSAQASDVDEATTEQAFEAATAGGVTVVTTDPHLGPTKGPRPGAIAAYGPDGQRLYYNDTYTKYYDVDPEPDEQWTVLYVSGHDLSEEDCPAKPRTELMGTRDGCRENVIERLNLSTGETTRVYTFYTDWRRWHDVDRIDEHRLAVADLSRNRVFILNTTSGINEWQWGAQSDISVATGGPFPQEFTHLNDVEVLADGRLMASLRNQDRVVFLTLEDGVQDDWTLGEEDNYEILREQHNPDYIPSDRGGPAVLVADSENNRVIEYQRVNGSWEESWVWRDPGMRWPRDADRLPNGHTLIADSDGGRVLEVDRNGEVVWSIRVDTPYDAERLGTGSESAGGESAASLGLASRTAGGVGQPREERTGRSQSGGVFAVVVAFLDFVIPAFIVNGVLYATPGWMGLAELLAAVGVVGIGVVWAAVELYWADYRLRLPVAKRPG